MQWLFSSEVSRDLPPSVGLPFEDFGRELMSVEPRHGARHEFKDFGVARSLFQLGFNLAVSGPCHSRHGVGIDVVELPFSRHERHGMDYGKEFPYVVGGVVERGRCGILFFLS